MSPRTTIQNEEIRQKSRTKIMQAALREFGNHGFESTSIAQIAKAAGVSKGLLYNYFDSKDILLQEIILNAIKEAEAKMAGLIVEDSATTIENIIRWTFKEVSENQDYWRLYTELSFKLSKHQFIHDMALAKGSEFISFLSHHLKQLGFQDPAKEARIFSAVMDGVGVHAMTLGDDYPKEEMEEFLIEKYCKKS